MSTENYQELLDYYKDCYNLIDCIHFNSNVAKGKYESILGQLKSITVPISHCGILDQRAYKHFSEDGLRVGFVGNDTPYKGLGVLMRAAKDLDIDIMAWGGKRGEKGRVHYRGKFKKEQLPQVYQEMDLLVVPSIWKETFSLVTLEALSYGVPVLVSDNVGAQDIVKEYDASFVYHTEKELRVKLAKLVDDKSELIEYNNSILSMTWQHDMKEHAKEILDKLYKGNS